MLGDGDGDEAGAMVRKWMSRMATQAEREAKEGMELLDVDIALIRAMRRGRRASSCVSVRVNLRRALVCLGSSARNALQNLRIT